MKKSLLVFIAVLITVSGFAQKTADVGIWGGASTYWGDLKQIDYAQSVNPLYGAFFRYNFNARYGARMMYLTGNMSAVGYMEGTRWEFPFRNVRNEVPEIKNYPDLMEDFLDYAPKRIHNILFMVEINYLKYILGLKKTPVSPYIMAGLGIMYYPYQLVPNTPLAESDIPLSFPDNFNEVYNIGISKFNPLQNKDDFAREESVTTLSIPFGMGVKTHIGPRFGIGVEFIIQKLFDDKLDNLDDPLAHINPIGDEITYSNLLHNNDFTAYLGINLTYKIYLGKEICPAYESKN